MRKSIYWFKTGSNQTKIEKRKHQHNNLSYLQHLHGVHTEMYTDMPLRKLHRRNGTIMTTTRQFFQLFTERLTIQLYFVSESQPCTNETMWRMFLCSLIIPASGNSFFESVQGGRLPLCGVVFPILLMREIQQMQF